MVCDSLVQKTSINMAHVCVNTVAISYTCNHSLLLSVFDKETKIKTNFVASHDKLEPIAKVLHTSFNFVACMQAYPSV